MIQPKVLITGIEGFTGRHLAEALRARGYHVHGTVLGGSESPNEHQCDLTKAPAIGKLVAELRPDHVVHLAAIAFVAHGDPAAFYLVNVLGTRNLLQAVAGSGHVVRKVLLASSANIYGNARTSPIDESVSPAPANDYAVSKLAMEYVARLWFDRLPIVLVRPFNYSGRAQSRDFLLPKIVSSFKRREPVLELGNLDVERDFSDVRVVADCYAKLLEVDATGEVFNVCSGRGQTLLSIVDRMEEIAGYRPEIRVNPAYVRANEVRRLVGSRARLEAALGDVQDIDLSDTLRWMFAAGGG